MSYRKLRTISCLLAWLAALGTYSPAGAATVTIDLTELAGPLVYDGEPLSASFDAGVRFTSIDSIVVTVVGQGEDGEARTTTYSGDPNSTDPPLIEEFAFAPPLLVGIAGPAGSPITDQAELQLPAGNESTWGVEFSFSAYEHLGSAYEQMYNTYFAPLHDGEGEIHLSSAFGFLTLPGTQIEVLEPSALEVASVQLTINGTLAVPTPGTGGLLLLSMGLAVGWRRRSIKAKSHFRQ